MPGILKNTLRIGGAVIAIAGISALAAGRLAEKKAEDRNPYQNTESVQDYLAFNSVLEDITEMNDNVTSQNHQYVSEIFGEYANKGLGMVQASLIRSMEDLEDHDNNVRGFLNYNQRAELASQDLRSYDILTGVGAPALGASLFAMSFLAPRNTRRRQIYDDESS